MAVNDGHRVRSSAINLRMDESFKIDWTSVFVQRLAVKPEFKDIVRRYLTRSYIPRKKKPFWV